MIRTQRGFTLIEILGALAISALMLAGLSAMIDNALDDTKGQQTALYQAQVADAASKYMTFNYATLIGVATPTAPVAINLNQLKLAGLLPSNISAQNNYQQTPCVLVLRADRNNPDGSTTALLHGLVVTEGGSAIPEKIIASIAAESGQGGGFFSFTAPNPLTARGAFNAWSLSTATTPTLANFIGTNCSGTPAGAGHLATALFYDGPGQLATDFLYRNAVPGRPELNKMHVPIHLASSALATEDTTDTRCATAADNGKVGATAAGHVLSCQSGVWRRQGSRFWRDWKATYADLPTGSTTYLGDVRLVTSLGRAFTWNGIKWVPLAADENNRFTSNDLLLERTVVAGTDCLAGDPSSTVAKDSSGLLLTCQSGKWQFQTSLAVASTETSCATILPSSRVVIDPPCNKPYTGTKTWASSVDTWEAPISRHVQPTKAGMISTSVWSMMSRSSTTNSNVEGQFGLLIQIFDDDTGALLGETRAQSTTMVNDSAGINANLTKVVKKNTNGYTIVYTTDWSTFDGGAPPYTRSNFLNYNGVVVEEVPLCTGWTLDLLQ